MQIHDHSRLFSKIPIQISKVTQGITGCLFQSTEVTERRFMERKLGIFIQMVIRFLARHDIIDGFYLVVFEKIITLRLQQSTKVSLDHNLRTSSLILIMAIPRQTLIFGQIEHPLNVLRNVWQVQTVCGGTNQVFLSQLAVINTSELS